MNQYFHFFFYHYLDVIGTKHKTTKSQLPCHLFCLFISKQINQKNNMKTKNGPIFFFCDCTGSHQLPHRQTHAHIGFLLATLKFPYVNINCFSLHCQLGLAPAPTVSGDEWIDFPSGNNCRAVDDVEGKENRIKIHEGIIVKQKCSECGR